MIYKCVQRNKHILKIVFLLILYPVKNIINKTVVGIKKKKKYDNSILTQFKRPIAQEISMLVIWCVCFFFLGN